MRNKITIRQKRWLLSAHLFCTVAWLGTALCSLVLNLTALFTQDSHLLRAIYLQASILDVALLRGGALGAILTGLLLSVLTQWGLFRFYWIMLKEIISVLCIAVGVIISSWNDEALALAASPGFQSVHSPIYLTDRAWMFLGIAFQLVSLSAVVVISVFKPWGQWKRFTRHRAKQSS